MSLIIWFRRSGGKAKGIEGYDRINASCFENKCVCFTLMLIFDKHPSFASVGVWQQDHYPVTTFYSIDIILVEKI